MAMVVMGLDGSVSVMEDQIQETAQPVGVVDPVVYHLQNGMFYVVGALVGFLLVEKVMHITEAAGGTGRVTFP